MGTIVDTSKISMAFMTQALVALCLLSAASAQYPDTSQCPDGYRGLPYTNSCYKLAGGSSKMTYADAEEYCKHGGGYLATITSQTEQDAVAQYLLEEGNIKNGHKAHYWIGLREPDDDGKWIWTNGEKVDYLGWRPGQPDDGKGKGKTKNYDCAALTYNDDYKWFDTDCDRTIAYPLCETQGPACVNYGEEEACNSGGACVWKDGSCQACWDKLPNCSVFSKICWQAELNAKCCGTCKNK